MQPQIFISATTADLRSARALVARVLDSIGYTPVPMETFPTRGWELRESLRRRLEPCEAVIQLVGYRYGEQPPEADPEFGRVSYTQYEALYAEQKKKEVSGIPRRRGS